MPKQASDLNKLNEKKKESHDHEKDFLKYGRNKFFTISQRKDI